MIKRWDLSGDEKKKESEIVNKIEKKNDKFDAILRDSDSNKIDDKLDAKEDKIKPPSKSRFLDYYFREAIIAEETRLKATKNGIFLHIVNFSCHFMYVIFLSTIQYICSNILI